MKRKTFLFLSIPIIIQIASSYLFKKAAISIDEFNLINVFSNVYYLASFFFFFLRAIIWQYILKLYSLSTAYTFQSLSVIMLLLVAYFAFDESITIGNIFGVLIINVGLILFFIKS